MEASTKKVSKGKIQIDPNSIYGEACSVARHYSVSVRTIRTLTIAQGFVVLSAIGFLTKEELFILSVFIGIFGLLLTSIFYFLYKHYLKLVLAASTYVRSLEKSFSPDIGGVWSATNKARSEFWSRWITRFSIDKAIFMLLALAMIVMIIHSSVNLL